MQYLGYFQEIWSSLRSGSARLNLLSSIGDEGGDDAPLGELAVRLINTRGEATSLVYAERLLERYKQTTVQEKRLFFQQLLTDFDLDAGHLHQVVTSYRNGGSPEDYAAIFNACTSGRQQLFSKIQEAPNGIHALVLLRADLRWACEQDASLQPIDVDLKALFLSWFNRGFLTLQAITWKTPAHVLEKIIAYEAVHEIHSWEELRKRLEPVDRRCYAFFHLAMPEEPLIFVEVALTTEVSNNIQTLLDGARTPIDSEQARAAIFYSISNCQPGLAGISFGHFLIKQVARNLSIELPALKEFVTLSPIPGFMGWLQSKAEDQSIASVLYELSDEQWPEHTDDTASIENTLKKLAAQYLVEELDNSGRPVDSVARFHLGNGARIERLNYLADTSDKGMMQSAGMMVNYYYDLTQVEHYHEAFALDQKIALSKAVKSLLDSA